MANIYLVINEPLPWKLPSGVLIQSGYYATYSQKYLPLVGENKKKRVSDKFNAKKMQDSFMPNFIHSLHGWLIALLYQHLFNRLNTWKINDSSFIGLNTDCTHIRQRLITY